ncbi:MAG TPA: HAD family acid phosphatase [Lacunisphaera sp.]
MVQRGLRILTAISLAAFLSGSSVPAAEPTNLSLCKHELAAYVQRGEYARQIADVALVANNYLLKRTAEGAKPGEKLAIVFDIDETMLSSLSEIEANDYGYVPKVWDHWVEEGQAPAILPVQAIYNTALRKNIAIFIITGRKESDQPGTERNLRQVGYEKWTRIIYHTAKTDPSLNNAGFKTEVRRKITEEGYTIIANIGDQASDLANGYAERGFKLPNPFYLAK